jgi:hypothetical protein
LRRLLEKIYSASATVGGGALFIISLLITADVLIRWLAGKPIGGVFEITEVAFLIIVFLSMAFTQYSNRQIRIDILYTLLNKNKCEWRSYIYWPSDRSYRGAVIDEFGIRNPAAGLALWSSCHMWCDWPCRCNDN